VSTDNDQSATVQALIDRIEARAYERGKADGNPTMVWPELRKEWDRYREQVGALTATAGGPADVISEHPILRKLRLLSLRWSELGGLVTGVDDQAGDPLTWEELHAYRHEYDAAHQNDAERPQTGQGGVAAPERAQA
jgi:hypothetical protein